MKTIWIAFFMLTLGMTVQAETYLFVGSRFPMLSEKTESGEYTGLGIDVARTICERLGHTFQVRLYPWVRAQHMVRTGEADVLIPPYKTPQREKWLDFSSHPFFTDKSFLFVRPGSTLTWRGDLASLKGMRIGMVPGWSVGAAFDRMKTDFPIDYAPTLDHCFKKLLIGRIDTVPTQKREANAVFDRLGLSGDQRPVVLLPVLATQFNYFGFTRQKDLAGFKTAFDRELKRMHESGEIDTLLRSKYGFRVDE